MVGGENKMNETSIQTMMELAIDKNNLDALVHLIIDNADLNYSGEDLIIANAETVLQFIKYIYPKTYKEKLEELKKEDI